MKKSFLISSIWPMVARWPHEMLLVYTRALAIATLLAGLILSVLLVLQLFVYEPAASLRPIGSLEPELTVDVIDRLELWIEDVEAERKTGFVTSDRPLFVSEDIAVESGR